jgi:hypothetical protein
MKKFKIVFWILLLVFIALVIYQNQGLFMAKQHLVLKLPFIDPLYTPELQTAVFFIAFFLVGLLVAYFFSLLGQFKSRKTIKVLNASAAARTEELNALKAENAELKKALPAGEGEAAAEAVPAPDPTPEDGAVEKADSNDKTTESSVEATS